MILHQMLLDFLIYLLNTISMLIPVICPTFSIILNVLFVHMLVIDL